MITYILAIALAYILGVLIFLTIYSKVAHDLVDIEDVWISFIELPLVPFALVIRTLYNLAKKN